ncbi:hypothetical protein [Agriterribacter sp.]|uniref:hypothetical protein n=1 Tax=Agriterribacter sp. TaxID=2821509 RepID=UPI002BF17C1D|nr:hypothetical protein [Agriterribacter sp.]HRP56550.1 hypothetical protein [Agriterribacter sp.]
MKKIILACFIMLFSGTALFAQQTQPAQPAQEKTKTAKKEVAHAKTHAVTADHQKQTTAAVKESSTTATATPLKKEGKDKQYKKHNRHVKKDGTTGKRSPKNKR